MIKSSLPAYQISALVNQTLREHSSLVITAPPGAGKSTLLPLTILEELDSDGKILMLEPRRLAARQVAERMAEMLGEKAGQTVGYRIRFESCVSSATRIEVITEGILTRMLIDDPTLEGVAVVIFDEFHERNIHSDVSLALCREVQNIIRPDLKLAIMSATIDASSICSALSAPLVESKGTMFPVEIIHTDSDINEKSRTEEIAQEIVKTILQAYRKDEGDILVFLPGQAEIERCNELLDKALNGSIKDSNENIKTNNDISNSSNNTFIYPLYGLMSNDKQRAAILPSPAGSRKIVLSTPIAETSLTIEGVRIVIDSGLHRKLVFSPQNALSHLTTARISMDMATQRSGRAGRLAPGICYRLWSLATEHRMEECRTPEILDADLAPTLLDIAQWGETDILRLPWLTPPPKAHIAQAQQLLTLLGAYSSSQHLKTLAQLPCHPRIAQMLITANSQQLKSLACDIAAILESKDFLSSTNDADINSRIILLRQSRNRYTIISKISAQYHNLIKVKQDNSIPNPYDTGKLIASAFPERIAKSSKEAHCVYNIASGGTASINPADDLSAHEWLAVASLNSNIFLASPLRIEDISEMVSTRENISWDNKQQRIIAQTESRIGRIIIGSSPLQNIPAESIIFTLCLAAPKYGLTMFDFNDKVQNLQRRISLVSSWHPELQIPDVSTDAVLQRAEDWLITTDISKVDMCDSIWSLLSYDQQKEVDRLAPTHIVVPTGSRIRVEYRQGAEQPILRVRLQECFGLQDTPRIDDGRQPVLIELLSPGFKPVQLTQDLRSFWSETYFEVRKELRRRYPKHSWPDNPLEAPPTRRIAPKK